MRLPHSINRFVLVAIAAVLVGATLAVPSAVRAAVFNPETFMLDNGMRVVVVSNHRVPVVAHMVWYKVGSADEPPGLSGIAHFLEHLMFKGTQTLAPGEFSKVVARNGGRENAFTSYDYTGYYQSVAKDRLEIVMRMEADRMTNLILTPEQIEPERLVILEERRQRTENDPSSILREHVDAALFLNHPYRRPIIGWDHEIRTLPVEEILSFYRRWYAPNNAVLVVAGDITAAELRPLAEKYYGVIPRGPDIVRSRPQEPPHHAARRVVLRDSRVGQPQWSRAYLAPSYGSGPSEQVYALEIAEEILGGGATSRLYRSLVIEQKLAVSAGTYYSPTARGPARFAVYASPRPGVTMADLEAAVEAVVKPLVEEGPSEDELERAKNRIQAQAVYARDSLRAGARVLGSALATGRTVEDVESWPERIGAVTVADIQGVLQEVVSEGRSVTALLLRDGATPEQAALK